MKQRDLSEDFSDVKNLQEHTFFPGQYVPFDMALFNVGGFVP